MFKKIIPYILILLVFVGLFGMAGKANAENCNAGTASAPLPNGCTVVGACNYYKEINGAFETQIEPNATQSGCKTLVDAGNGVGDWTPNNPPGGNKVPWTNVNGGTINTTGSSEKTPFENEINANKCGIMQGTIYPGCFIQLFNAIFYIIPSFLLTVSAYFFNVLVSITLSSSLFTMGFVGEAWGIVRDLSNIFFILILLYIAVKIILDLGGHEAKQMIAKVIVIALLINFSMFFTNIIIDASNILALIFYNKVSVSTKDAQGNERPYQKTGNGEKDVAGGLVNAFNPTKLLSQEYITNARTQTIDVNGTETKVVAQTIAPGILIGMLLVAGVLMFFAAYCLVIVGLSFMGRLIELFVLIIFSPFAFMSSTVPLLSSIEYLGWGAWFKRLLKVSFMAPIFMFFLYFIFMLIKADIFQGLKSGTTGRLIESIIMIVLPAVLILILLLKATDFAKKGSGAFGEAIFKGAQMLGGLALGAATGGAALLGTKALGGLSSKMADSEWLKNKATKDGKDSKGLAGWAARKTLKTADYGSKATFDIRKTGAGKAFGGATGMNLGSLGSRDGGFKGRGERRSEELKKESALYKTGKSDADVKAMTQNKLDKYNQGLEEAKRNGTEEEYKKNNTPPEVYDTAAKLNAARMKAFQDSLGSSGLLGALAHTIERTSGGLVETNETTTSKDGKTQVPNPKYFKESPEYKKWRKEKSKLYDQAIKDNNNEPLNEEQRKRIDRMYGAKRPEPTEKSINDSRVATTKMMIGAVAGLATGGVAGGLAMGTIGGAAASAAGTAAGAYGGTTSMSEKAGQAKFIKGTEKDKKEMEKVTNRLKENTEAMGKLTNLVKQGNDLVKDDEGKQVKLVRDDNTVDTEEIERQLARLVFIEKTNDLELKKLYEQGKNKDDPRVQQILKSSMSDAITKGQLNKLKTAEKDMKSLDKESYELGKDKHKVEHDQEGSPAAHAPSAAGGGASKPPKAPEAPHGGGGESKPAAAHGAPHG